MQYSSDFEDVLAFWLREVDAEGAVLSSAHWWKKDPTFDQEIRDRFEPTYDTIVAGQLESWLDTARGRLAYIVVLDQFSRNMYRDTGKMYDADERVLDVALKGIQLGMDRQVGVSGRMLYYMPTMHSESRAVQEQGVQLFEDFVEDYKGTPYETNIRQNLDFAIRHRDIVVRFDRFPHRNALLGRTSTPEEVEFLTQPGSSF